MFNRYGRLAFSVEEACTYFPAAGAFVKAREVIKSSLGKKLLCGA